MAAVNSNNDPINPVRVLDVEHALQWVYFDEMPKLREDGGGIGAAAGMHPMWRGGVFLSRIDNWTKPPGYPAAMGDPDPDALAIDGAIRALDVDQLELRDTLITYGLGAHNIDSVGLLERAREGVKASLVAYAARRKRPELEEEHIIEPVRHAVNGKISLFRTETHEYETVDGGTVTVTHPMPTQMPKAGEYLPGTHCDLRYFPTIPDRALARARYAVWWLALQYLARGIPASVVTLPCGTKRPLLARTALRAPRAPQYPWIPGEAHEPRIRASSRGSIDMGGRALDYRLDEAQLDQRRPLGRRAGGRRHSEVRHVPVTEYVPGDKRA